jgi:hypothetical protein
MTSEIKSKNGKPKSGKPAFAQAQFVNYDLTDDDKGKFKTWSETYAERIGELLNNACDAGYRITIKRDTYHDCFAAWLQTDDEKSGNYGYILSGRSRSGTMALFGVLFRHYVLFETDWPVETARRAGMDDD